MCLKWFYGPLVVHHSHCVVACYTFIPISLYRCSTNSSIKIWNPWELGYLGLKLVLLVSCCSLTFLVGFSLKVNTSFLVHNFSCTRVSLVSFKEQIILKMIERLHQWPLFYDNFSFGSLNPSSILYSWTYTHNSQPKLKLWVESM